MGITVEPARINAALKATPYHFVGIRAVPADPPSGPVFPLTLAEDAFPQFWYSLKLARGFWPGAVDFEIVGSNSVIKTGQQSLNHPSMEAMPPDAIRLQTPASILTFRIVS